MERIEYRTADKSSWIRGTWDNEPDKVQFYDEGTDLPCLIVRSNWAAFLCGYVGVRPGHPWHGKHYDELDAQVHGGLTFAGGCSHGDPATSICHIPREGDTDDVWWLGFDCAHGGDFAGGPMDLRIGRYQTYRDMSFVENEIRSLARQAAEAVI